MVRNQPTHEAQQQSYESTQAFADTLVGKTEEAVREMAAAAAIRVRVASRDGRPNLLTQDMRMDRVSLHIEDGIVTKVSCG